MKGCSHENGKSPSNEDQKSPMFQSSGERHCLISPQFDLLLFLDLLLSVCVEENSKPVEIISIITTTNNSKEFSRAFVCNGCQVLEGYLDLKKEDSTNKLWLPDKELQALHHSRPVILHV